MSEVNSNFAYEYLSERNDYIEGRKTELLNKCNQNQLQIDELKEKIVEIKDNYDETYELFSPKPRTSEFSKTEMAVLATRQSELLADNQKYLKKIEKLKDEQEKIKICFRMLKEGKEVDTTVADTARINTTEFDRKCATSVYMNDRSNMEYLLENVIGEINETSKDLKSVIKNHITLKNVESRLAQTKKKIYESVNEITGVRNDENLKEKMETIVEKLNLKCNQKIQFSTEGESEIDSASEFAKDMIYRLSRNILKQITNDIEEKITFRLVGKAKHVNIIIEIPIESKYTKEKLFRYYIDRKESTITVKDLIEFSNADEAEFDDAEKKQFIIRIDSQELKDNLE